MDRRRVAAGSLGAVIILAWACGNNRNPNIIVDTGDSGAPGFDAGEDIGVSEDVGNSGADGSTDPCFFVDEAAPSMELDPVALCLQERALTSELQHAYTAGQGVAPGWSSTGSYPALAGHDWQDDLGLAGALGAFRCSAEEYGNTHSTAAFSTALTDLGGVLVGELREVPSPTAGMYDGEVYFRMRWAQAGFQYVDQADADTLKGLADAYGAALASQAYPVAGGGDAGLPGGMVIGTKNADGSVAYAPAWTAMAAAALLDMANLQAEAADAGSAASSANIAQQVLEYVLARGRDPVTGLFYQSLVTSQDPDHDAVGPGTPTNDSMLTETQAWIMLALARAQDLLATFQAVEGVKAGAPDGSAPVQPIYWLAGDDLASAMTTAGLFDGTPTPPTPPSPGALMEGLILSDQQLLTNKTTIGNAVMLGAFHRVVTGEGSLLSYQLGEVRTAITQLLPANSSLLSIVNDGSGEAIQQSYLRAGSKGFGYAVAYAPGGDGRGEGGVEQGATNYRSDALHAMIEGITQVWHGAANDPQCAP